MAERFKLREADDFEPDFAARFNGLAVARANLREGITRYVELGGNLLRRMHLPMDA